MVHRIALGCPVRLGHGGLGFHLDFVRRAAELSGKATAVYCSHGHDTMNLRRVTEIPGSRYFKFTPLRWLPSYRVLLDSIHFDRSVCRALPSTESIVYHSFPGYATKTFEVVHHHKGISILEAATLHVLDLFEDVGLEHRKMSMKGSPFSPQWVGRVQHEYDRADYVTVASYLQMESLIRRGIPEHKIIYAPLGIDTSRFSPQKDQASMLPRREKEPFRIVQVGQVSLLKGFHYLLEAVRSLDYNNIEVTFVGGIGWRKIRQLAERYRSHGINVSVISGDPVPHLRKAHICVHAAIQDGFGLAPLEAMSTGVPVIVTDHTGMKDVIIPNENGIIVPRRNVDALSRAIGTLLRNDDMRTSMAKKARNSALAHDIDIKVSYYAQALSSVWGM